jgi:hypothetical protein
MSAFRGANQAPIITQRYLNTAGYAGDPSSGNLVSTSQVSGSIVQGYGGQIGGILTLSESEAAYYSDLTNGQLLYPGDYQYVRFYPLSTNNAVQGQVVFWQSLSGQAEQIIVTPDYFADGPNGPGLIAGIALCNIVKGNYWFIQIAGVAEVKFKASPGVTSPSVGDLIYVDYTTPSVLADDPTQSGSPTNAQLKLVLGRAWNINPKGSTISPVLLSGFFGYAPGSGGA